MRSFSHLRLPRFYICGCIFVWRPVYWLIDFKMARCTRDTRVTPGIPRSSGCCEPVRMPLDVPSRPVSFRCHKHGVSSTLPVSRCRSRQTSSSSGDNGILTISHTPRTPCYDRLFVLRVEVVVKWLLGERERTVRWNRASMNKDAR